MDKDLMEKLAIELESGSVLQRRAASYKLGRSKLPDVVPVLIRAYGDTDSSVRLNVIEGLKQIGSKESVEFLSSIGISASKSDKPTSARDRNLFLLGFAGWLILSLVVNRIALDLFDLYEGNFPGTFPGYILNPRFAMLLATQLIGLSLAYLSFRRKNYWISYGIVLASIPYLLGTVMIGTCGLPGWPFPISIGMC